METVIPRVDPEMKDQFISGCDTCSVFAFAWLFLRFVRQFDTVSPFSVVYHT